MDLTNLTLETAAVLAADFATIKNTGTSLGVYARVFENRLKGETETGYFGEMSLKSLSDCIHLHSETLAIISGKLGQIADENTEVHHAGE